MSGDKIFLNFCLVENLDGAPKHATFVSVLRVAHNCCT